MFGWEANTVDLGEIEFTMLRRPGYGDFLEVRDPDLRRRLADFGAPEGFEDAIATIVPMSSDQPPDAPAHWRVMFAVDDTDAIAERAAKLGATVIVPPFDAGPTRVAVLNDPQGAQFSVGKYNPT